MHASLFSEYNHVLAPTISQRVFWVGGGTGMIFNVLVSSKPLGENYVFAIELS